MNVFAIFRWHTHALWHIGTCVALVCMHACMHCTLILYIATSMIVLIISHFVAVGEAVWSTAPSSPTSSHKLIDKKSSGSSAESLERSGNTEESKGCYGNGGGGIPEGGERQLPRHISSNHITGRSGDFVTSPTGGQKFPQIPDMGVVSPSSPSKIHRGFIPNLGPLDTTNTADLPGSRGDEVITTPPHSQANMAKKISSESHARTSSIEEADRQREGYAPIPRMSGGRKGKGEAPPEDDSNSFCLGLSSLIMTPEGEHGGEKKTDKEKMDRKGSSASTTSVSGPSIDLVLLP